MKKTTSISIGLILLGFIFEFLYLGTDKMFFMIKFWVLGVICIIAGSLGLLVFTILPISGHRAKTSRKFKGKFSSEKSKNQSK